MNITTVTSRKILPTTLAAALTGILMVSGCSKQSDEKATTDAPVETAEKTASKTSSAADKAHMDRLLISYADMAHAAYKDSLEMAKLLQGAVNTYVETPTQANLDAAKAAYKAARQPYSQTEVFRFDEGFVTANDNRNIGSTDSW